MDPKMAGGIGHPGCVTDSGSTDLSGGVTLRLRSPSDLEAGEHLARRVHARDGYPPHIPNDDFIEFLVSPEAIGAGSRSAVTKSWVT
jgi:hypothetical protein